MSFKKTAALAIIASLIITFALWIIGAIIAPKIPDGRSTQQVVYNTYIPENDLTRKDI